MSPSRRVSLALVLVGIVACSGERTSPAAQPGLELTLPRPQPRVGEQELKVAETRMTMRLHPPGRVVTSTWHKRTEELLKVVAVDGFAVREAEVTYTRIAESNEIDGRKRTEPDPRAGKTYRVARERGVLVARPLAGAATDEELEEVIDDNDEIGVASEIDAIVASKTWHAGQPVAFTPDELARVDASRARRPGADRETLTRMELTLRSQHDGVAVLATTMGMRIESARGQFGVTLTGEARIEVASGRILELGGSGALDGEIQGVRLDGTMTMKVQSRWVSAP